MAINSITVLSANANNSTWKALGGTTTGNANRWTYVFADGTNGVRLRVAGAGTTDYIIVASSATRGYCLGQDVNQAGYEVLSNAASAADIKIVVCDYPLAY